MDPHARYDNPLIDRYASREMAELWGPRRKFSTWRRLWVALAEAEAELGLNITASQIAELRAHVDDVDFARAAEFEKRLRHDVMAHVHTFGEQCPNAKAIIHLGATSAYVTDNTDLLLMRDSLGLLRDRLVGTIEALACFAERHRALPCLGFTHFQPAQPTTVGKRATLWCHDLLLDLTEIEHRLATIRCRGVKGATGTQASFLELFQGDHARVERLDQRIAEKLGFPESYDVTGQTYARKVDAQVLDVLAGICISGHKFATDLRLLANRRELEEPFEDQQIGSSAMPYKRNPMRAERLCSIARFVWSTRESAAQTAAVQWLERTLDDSANRRLTIPQAFLGTDAVVRLFTNIVTGLVVYPDVIARNLAQELPFLATENILLAAVQAGGDRQELHERIRQHTQAAANEIKRGRDSDLLSRLKNDPAFANIDLASELKASRYVGRAPEQVDRFIATQIEPIRRRYPNLRDHDTGISV